MTQALPPRTSQLMRIVDLEHRDGDKEKRLTALESAHKEFDIKLDGVREVLLQIKTALWLFGKIGGALVGLAIISGAVMGVLHALGH